MIGKDIALAIDLLKKGEVVAIPTETVYGLAANALNETAVLNIFKIKNRPSFDPLIAHFSSFEKIKPYVKNIHPKAETLAAEFMPGPLTMLLEKQEIVPDIVTSGSKKMAVRVPKHPMALEVLSALNFPLAAPSANPFGFVSPTSALHVEKQLGEKTPYILDGGECEIGLESTIIDCTEWPFKVLRLGGLSLEKIEACLGESLGQNLIQNSNPTAPGQLDKHYATHTPLYIVENLCAYKNIDKKTIAMLAFGDFETNEDVFVLNLSKKGDIDEAAQNLFKNLRHLDEQNFDEIITSFLPANGLGKAINDRLSRAAHKD